MMVVFKNWGELKSSYLILYMEFTFLWNDEFTWDDIIILLFKVSWCNTYEIRYRYVFSHVHLTS